MVVWSLPFNTFNFSSMSNIQPTGILARVFFHHEKGARMDVISQHAQLKELGVAPETYDGSIFFQVGTALTLNEVRYEIISLDFQVMPFLNSASVPDIDPATYFTDTSEMLPNNLFINVTLRPL
jgi:hypothetical protein